MDDSEIATKEDLNTTNEIVGELKSRLDDLKDKVEAMSQKLDSMSQKFDQLDSNYIRNSSSSIQDALRSIGSGALGEMVFSTPVFTARFSMLQDQISALASKVGGS